MHTDVTLKRVKSYNMWSLPARSTHPIPLRFTGVPWCVSATYFDSSIIHNVLLSVKIPGNSSFLCEASNSSVICAEQALYSESIVGFLLGVLCIFIVNVALSRSQVVFGSRGDRIDFCGGRFWC